MQHTLLTGVTGLVGRYLVRDLLLAGVPLALLVRPSRRASARQRVDAALAYWEDQLGRTLPRPVVLEGDISEPDLGLDARTLRWVAERCDSLLHNAASLQFVSTGPESEPWRSNIHGTRNVLDVCEQAGIRKFHHVSTAYVCGLREGRILESELDVGQTLSNDYEQSKVDAEKMVRGSTFLDEVTVYRPAIITGDSKTGYTTTYHGFYAPVQLVWTIAQSLDADATGHREAVGRFPLHGYETKNLVPVEWVSAVMAHIFTHPEHHGKTYHLTPRHKVPARLWGDVLEEACRFYSVRFEVDQPDAHELTERERTFRELIGVYATYWRDDPTFDSTNTQTACPHLPCPHMDRDTLLMMARWAIESNFNGPRAKPLPVPFDAYKVLEPLVEAGDFDAPSDLSVALEVCGLGGGTWQLATRNGFAIAAELGSTGDEDLRITLDCDVLGRIVRGELSAAGAFEGAQIATSARRPGLNAQRVAATILEALPQAVASVS
jgi:thioester reductase-like protein